MTCPPRNDSRRRGFTLIEIIVVLVIIAVITGGSIAAMLANSTQRALSNASSEMELLAKKARTAAILNQTPYAIEFHGGLARLVPYSETADPGRTTAMGNSIGGQAAGAEGGRSVRQEIGIDPEITLSVRRWNTAEFLAPDGAETVVWRFDPDGLSEPLTVRFTLGNSYAQDTYHPLTAAIADSELEVN